MIIIIYDSTKWYIHKPETVLENETKFSEILRYKQIA